MKAAKPSPSPRQPPARRFIDTLPEEYQQIISAVRGQTMITEVALTANLDAICYIVQNRIPGVIIECGVWRGGSMAAIARMLAARGDVERDLYLFDTFAGMTRPTDEDVNVRGQRAAEKHAVLQRDGHNEWAFASLSDVKETMNATSYPPSRIHYIQGDVMQTVPAFVAKASREIALLRLDTDWYESTKVELQYLYPRVVSSGVVIVDDYGHWRGSRLAVDQQIASLTFKPFLFRIDRDRRVFLKS